MQTPVRNTTSSWAAVVAAVALGFASAAATRAQEPPSAPTAAAQPAPEPAPAQEPAPVPAPAAAEAEQPEPEPDAPEAVPDAPPATPRPVPVAPAAPPPAPIAPEAVPPVPPVPPPPELTAEEAQALEMADRPVLLEKARFRPGKGLSFESADGDFALVTRLRAQFLYTAESNGVEQQSFQIRRARLQFGGHTFGENNRFKVELAISPGDVGQRGGNAPSTSVLLDWYYDFTYLRDLTLRVGQYKVPYNRQRVVSSGDLRLVDRSIVNAEFNLDRDIGVDVRSDDLFGLEMLRYYAGVYVGEGRNTNQLADFGNMYLARVELLPMGDFDDYKEADLERLDAPKLSIGIAYAHIENSQHDQGILGNLPSDGGVTDFQNFAADLVFRVAGFSVESEFMWRNGDRQFGEDGELTAARDGYGLTGQAGYLFPGTLFELAGRASMIRARELSSLADGNEYGGGASYYFAEHALKLQADYFYLGEREPGAGAYEWEHRVRVQLQASF